MRITSGDGEYVPNSRGKLTDALPAACWLGILGQSSMRTCVCPSWLVPGPRVVPPVRSADALWLEDDVLCVNRREFVLPEFPDEEAPEVAPFPDAEVAGRRGTPSPLPRPNGRRPPGPLGGGGGRGTPVIATLRMRGGIEMCSRRDSVAQW